MKNILIIFVEAALYLCGAGSEEEFDQDAIEMFEHYESNPLSINTASERTLRQSGMLSDYRIASLLDYIARNGEILSWNELAGVDGFGVRCAEALSHFCTLRTTAPIGSRPGRSRFECKGQGRLDYKGQWNLKARAGWRFGMASGSTGGDRPGRGGKVQGAAAFKNGALTSACVSWDSPRWHLVAGSFNARFGQGLSRWSGFRITTLTSVEGFALNPTGISESLSYGSSHLDGLAAGFSAGPMTLSAYASAHAFGADATFRTRTGTYSIGSHSNAPLSLSARATVGIFTLFGELTPGSAVAGSFLNLAYDKRLALRLIATPKECGAAAGLRLGAFESVAFAHFNPSKGTSQHRITTSWKPLFINGDVQIKPELRSVFKYKPVDTHPWRAEIRGSVETSLRGWMFKVRADAAASDNLSWLFFAEAGRQSGQFRAFVRAGAFRIDSWADRIYVYERDVTGMFNVPAYYGRGWNVSYVAGWRGLEIRLSTTRYAKSSGKVPKYEARIQYNLRL